MQDTWCMVPTISPDNSKHKGSSVDGINHGHGIQTLRCDDRYEENFLNDKRHGRLEFRLSDEEDNWIDNDKSEHGVCRQPDGNQ